MTMRKFWFAIIDIALLMAVSCAENDDDKEMYSSNDSGSRLGGKEVLLGDMILSDDQMNYLYSSDSQTRLALASPFSRWPNATVFYDMDKSLDRKSKEVVLEAMDYIQNVSCVRFRVRDDKTTPNYVLIKAGHACNSKVGMRRGEQQMIIDGKLCSKGSVIHELLHGLGFLHMHTASIRDDYIKINWKNIRDDAKLNFKPFTKPVSMFETEYDYDSILHYSAIAFAKDKRKPTITAKNPAPNMGQRKEMSAGDITRLNRLYNCPIVDDSSITLNRIAKSLTQFPNGVTIKRVELNKTTDNADDPQMENTTTQIELNLNETLLGDEDDMMLSQEQIDALFSLNAVKRNGLKNAFHHWPMGVVAFEIDPTFTPDYISTIYAAMDYIMNVSCIQFAPRTSYHENYVYITKGSGCSSEVGMKHTGQQLVNINEQLCQQGKIIHELLHSLGFLHMHTANERDDFVKVNWENIKRQAWPNFKQFQAHVSMFNTSYDFESIMHYSPQAFAIDRSIPSLLPLRPAKNMGQREAMSDGDVIRLNRMYKCGPEYNTGDNPPTQPKSTSSEIENHHKHNSSIFGMFIFKIIQEN